MIEHKKRESVFLHIRTAGQMRFAVGIIVVLLLVSAGGVAILLSHSHSTLVTNLQDAGSGSLRQAIDTANAGSTITFNADLSGTIMLTSGNLILAKNLTIRGPSSDQLAISSGSHGFAIQIGTNASVSISGLAFKNSTIKNAGKTSLASFITNAGTLTLTNTTVSGNTAIGGNGFGGNGGGIFNLGTLTLMNSIVSGNHTDKGSGTGGGIYNLGGTLVLIKSTISNNTASGSIDNAGSSSGLGGGIYNEDAILILINSIISSNTATSSIDNAGSNSGLGGGIYSHSTGGVFSSRSGSLKSNTVTLTDSTIADNTATGGSGGGIYNFGSLLTLTTSTVSGNTASGIANNNHGISNRGGGGIANTGGEIVSNRSQGHYIYGTLTLTNSTITGNAAPTSSGGGILNQGSQTNMIFCTIYGNTAMEGGGIASKNSYAAVSTSGLQMSSTIVAGNHASTAPDLLGTLTSNGYNLIQSPSGAAIQEKSQNSSNLIGVSPQVGSLQNNGGPTFTLALLPGSPAIDSIPLDACHPNGIFTDQRGVQRPQRSACDIGAYEYQPST